jgi:hypothetical protein
MLLYMEEEEFNPLLEFELMVKEGISKKILDEEFNRLYLKHGTKIPMNLENARKYEVYPIIERRLKEPYYRLNEIYKFGDVIKISRLAQATAEKILESNPKEFDRFNFEITFSERQQAILYAQKDIFKAQVEKLEKKKRRTRDHFKKVSLAKLIENEEKLKEYFRKGAPTNISNTSPSVSPISSIGTTRSDKKRGLNSSASGSSRGTRRSNKKGRRSSRASRSSIGTDHSGGTAKYSNNYT